MLHAGKVWRVSWLVLVALLVACTSASSGASPINTGDEAIAKLKEDLSRRQLVQGNLRGNCFLGVTSVANTFSAVRQVNGDWWVFLDDSRLDAQGNRRYQWAVTHTGEVSTVNAPC